MTRQDSPTALSRELARVRACRHCAAMLPFPPRPVVQIATSARLLIVGQAPGRKVHEPGIPWNDDSGNRLRAWTLLEPADFYDESRIAIVPMGFCYPGVAEAGGDNPPPPECATLWHERLLALLPERRLTLLVGQYAQRFYLGPRRKRNLTETVRAFAEYGPHYFPLPHPSWRSQIWSRRNPWFADLVLPACREAVRNALA